MVKQKNSPCVWTAELGGIYFIFLFYHLHWEQQHHNLKITAVDSEFLLSEARLDFSTIVVRSTF